MQYIKYLINLPWTILGLCNLVFCLPQNIELRKDALIFRTHSCGLVHLYAPKAKGVAIGNIVVVEQSQPQSIVDHELVHIEQQMRRPFIHQFLYWYELLSKGYWNNCYEIEAYTRTNTWPADTKQITSWNSDRYKNKMDNEANQKNNLRRTKCVRRKLFLQFNKVSRLFF